MHLRTLLPFLTIAAVGVAACDRVDPCPPAGATASAAPVAIVAPSELLALRDADPALVVLDVNPRDIYDEGHVPGARWARYDRVDHGLLPADRAAPLVVYCFNPTCGASDQAAQAIAAAGWTGVRRMAAGIEGWRAAGLPVEAGR